MNNYAVSFVGGNFISIFADFFSSRYSVICGTDIIEFFRDGKTIANVIRDQIKNIEVLDFIDNRSQFVKLAF